MKGSRHIQIMTNKLVFTLFFLFFFFFFFSLPLASAAVVLNSDNDVAGVKLIAPPIPGFNNNTGFVNSSNYWDNLDTPSDITESKYWYNHTADSLIVGQNEFLNLTGRNAKFDINITPYDFIAKNLISEFGINASGNSFFESNITVDTGFFDKIGIGTTAPEGEMHINGSGITRVLIESTGDWGAGFKIKNTGGTWTNDLAPTGDYRIRNDDTGGAPLLIETTAYNFAVRIRSSDIRFNAPNDNTDFKVSGATTDNVFVVDAGTESIRFGQDSDNVETIWGDGQDASVKFNSTDWLFNPKRVGTGKMFVLGDLTATGNFTGNQIYGSIWGHGTGITPLTQNVYSNITNMSDGVRNGVGWDIAENNSLIILYDGDYLITSQFSFTGTANTEYHLALGIDSARSDMCHAERKMGTGNDIGSASYSCIEPFVIGQKITVMVENVDSDADINVDDIQLNLLRISD